MSLRTSGRQRLTKSVSQALRALSPGWRSRVRRKYRMLGAPAGRLTDGRREILARAISLVLDEVEPRSPGAAYVRGLRATMNVLFDDTGQNEPHPGVWVAGQRVPARYPDVEETERLMLQRRRTMTPEQRAAAAGRLQKAREA